MQIKQVETLVGMTQKNIRFYERKGLLEPERNDQSKYRNYSEQDIRRLKQIILYRKMNMPIEKIASMLDDPAVSEELVRQQLQEGIEFHRNRYRQADRYLAYFQSFSNTYAPLDRLKTVFAEAFELPEVAGIIVGTRPDCIDGRKLDYLAELAQRYYVTIEYGIESCYDKTLQEINRGHDFDCALRAVEATAARGIPVGAHFILGLPGETRAMMQDQVGRINALPLTTVKFHQLQIFKGTRMAEMYREHPADFQFFGVDEYIDFVIDLLERIRPDLVLERFASEAPPRYQAGPTWGLIRNEQLWSRFECRLRERDTFQGALFR